MIMHAADYDDNYAERQCVCKCARARTSLTSRNTRQQQQPPITTTPLRARNAITDQFRGPRTAIGPLCVYVDNNPGNSV